MTRHTTVGTDEDRAIDNHRSHYYGRDVEHLPHRSKNQKYFSHDSNSSEKDVTRVNKNYKNRDKTNSPTDHKGNRKSSKRHKSTVHKKDCEIFNTNERCNVQNAENASKKDIHYYDRLNSSRNYHESASHRPHRHSRSNNNWYRSRSSGRHRSSSSSSNRNNDKIIHRSHRSRHHHSRRDNTRSTDSSKRRRRHKRRPRTSSSSIDKADHLVDKSAMADNIQIGGSGPERLGGAAASSKEQTSPLNSIEATSVKGTTTSSASNSSYTNASTFHGSFVSTIGSTECTTSYSSCSSFSWMYSTDATNSCCNSKGLAFTCNAPTVISADNQGLDQLLEENERLVRAEQKRLADLQARSDEDRLRNLISLHMNKAATKGVIGNIETRKSITPSSNIEVGIKSNMGKNVNGDVSKPLVVDESIDGKNSIGAGILSQKLECQVRPKIAFKIINPAIRDLF